MFIPTHESVLDMSPTDFEKYSLQILLQQVKHLSDCKVQHNKIIEVDDGNYQIDGYIEFKLMGVTYKTIVECKHYKSSISREKVQ
ncbi:restriction endonuclease, partial [Clostridium sp. A1-XYC3]